MERKVCRIYLELWQQPVCSNVVFYLNPAELVGGSLKRYQIWALSGANVIFKIIFMFFCTYK